MSSREQLPRWPLRLHLERLRLFLFGWMNSEAHREYRKLVRENRRLRRAIREREQSARRSIGRRVGDSDQ